MVTNYYYSIIDNNVIFYARSSGGTAGISVYKNMKEGDSNFKYFCNVADENSSYSSIICNPKSTVKELFTKICLDIINRVDVGIVNWKEGPIAEINCMEFESVKKFMEFLECNM